MFIYKLKELYLIQTLVKEILVVFNYFKADIHSRAKIMCLYHPAECSGAKIFSDAISSGNN